MLALLLVKRCLPCLQSDRSIPKVVAVVGFALRSIDSPVGFVVRIWIPVRETLTYSLSDSCVLKNHTVRSTIAVLLSRYSGKYIIERG